MNVLLWRAWAPLYAFPATFSAIPEHSIGGTCSQLLWHARNLVEIGCTVQVLGVSDSDVIEERVDFVGARNAAEQQRHLSTGRVNTPDVILLEGGYSAACVLRAAFPRAKLVHIGQNIDRYGGRGALGMTRDIDLYAFVSLGHFSDYCVRMPRLRHKFCLIRNVVPWNWLYKQVQPLPVEDTVIWVGGWTKKGLRSWAKIMERILAENPTYRWVLCGPSYGQDHGGLPPYIFQGLSLPRQRIEVKTLPLCQLAAEISSARIVLVSLGNETACISALDAHAMARPVVSGNDMVFKHINPEGTGIRISAPEEQYRAVSTLLGDPELCDRLGQAGKSLVLHDYTEASQKVDLLRTLSYLEVKDRLLAVGSSVPPSAWRERVSELHDKLERKFLVCGGMLANK